MLGFYAGSSAQTVVDVFSADLVFNALAILGIIAGRDNMDGSEAIVLYTLINRMGSQMHVVSGMLANLSKQLSGYTLVQDFVSDPHEESPLEGEPLPKSWPHTGTVRFKDAVFNYTHETPSNKAIDHLSVEVEGGCNCGIAGGRGSGKSTLVNLLFAIGKLSHGSVTIDGFEVGAMNKRALRRQLAMVPQKPVIFQGTIRDNVCPKIVGDARHEALHQDSTKMLATLKQCRLEQVVAELGGLDATVSAQDFSQGQRQLLCAARALLRDSSVLVLDEATASLDKASASLLQETIYEVFTGTVINIAHHLDFVRDAHKVLCLNAGGTIADFDTPKALSANPKSLFAALERAEAHDTAGK